MWWSMATTACALSTSTRPAKPTYARRRPEKSTLYRIVAEHAETVFAEAEASSQRGGYPKYVKDEVAAFIRCGLLQHGFARFSCRACGEERLVAFSCKKRGLCPSCIAKRSALTAAHLCDAVLPVCPYRQWTLSLPYALRLRLIRDGALFTKVIRTFVRTVFSWQRRKAKALGHRKVHCGSVTFAQRFGSLLQLTPHAHTWIPDGVFVEQDDGELSFVPLSAPTDEEIDTLCRRLAKRISRVCRVEDDDEPIEDDDDAVIASVQAEAVRAPLRQPHFFDDVPEAKARKRSPLCAQHAGFSLHAGLWVEARKRQKLERLLRYGSRPPFAQKRLSLLPSGKVRLELRKPLRTGQTQLVLEPEAFLRRLFAIIPPPRWHLTRFHGVFSGHHRLRRKLATLLPEPPPPPLPRDDAEPRAALIDDEQTPSESRIAYAQLLSRVFEADIGCCQRCGGELRFVACIDEPDAIAKILTHLGLSTEVPKLAPARSPPQTELADWDTCI
jgi:hypothetical protein